MSAIGKPLVTPDLPDTGFGPVEVEVVPDAPENLLVDLDGEKSGPDISTMTFESNLALFMDEAELGSLGSELKQSYNSDKNSRSQWEESLADGMELLGLTFEDRTIPWVGACGVFHPLLTETLVRFQAQAIMEIFQPGGPVRTQIIGRSTAEKEALASRKEDEMNYILLEKMQDYRAETEQLLFRLGLAGSAFRKIYYDPTLKRPAAMYIPAEDFIVAYGTTDLRTCPRATHVMRRTPNEVRKMQVLGFYRDVQLPTPQADYSQLDEKYDRIRGVKRPVENDDRHLLLEMCVDLNLAGFEDTQPGGEQSGVELPYVVTIDWQSGQVLSIYRNWSKADPFKERRQYYVKWNYLPGLGFYGIGLVHLIGGMAKSATSILRQLVDAGTLSNLPGGLKARGLRIKGDSTPIMPGEWRDVDISSGAIRDNIMPLPYKEPSAVLLSLLQGIVDEAKRMGAVADLAVAEGNQQAPVGTTLALLEREMKVMSAVQARLHDSLKEEFRLLADVISNDMGPEYYTNPEDGADRQKDFSSNLVAVIPVSDPNASTTGQRILQYQAAMSMAQQAPQLFDLPTLARETLSAYGIRNSAEIVKDPSDIKPMDPVSENMSILNGKPVKAFLWQDHDAHIAVHMAAVQDPKIQQMVGQSPQASLIGGSAAAHIVEHLGFKYRAEIEKELGAQLPPPGEPLPPDVEVRLSRLVAAAASKLFQKDKAEAAAQEAQKNLQDPVIQMQMQELQIKQAEASAKAKQAETSAQLEAARLQQQKEIEFARMASAERIAGAQIGSKAKSDLIQQQADAAEREGKLGVDVARIGADAAMSEGDQKARVAQAAISAAAQVASSAQAAEAQKAVAEKNKGKSDE